MATRVSNSLSSLIKSWLEINNSQGKWIRSVMEDKPGYGISSIGNFYILQKIRTRLNLYGVDGFGNKLAPYSKKTIAIRKKLGLKTTPTSLRQTGNWQRSLMIDYKGAGKRHILEVRANKNAPKEPEKSDYLRNKYGVGIFKITEKEDAELTEVLSKKYSELFDIDFNLEIK